LQDLVRSRREELRIDWELMQDLVRSRREELRIGLGTYARLGAFPS